MKNLNEMTEEEVLEAVARAIPTYTSTLKYHRDFNLSECVKAQEKELQVLFKRSLGLSHKDTMSYAQFVELDTLFAYFQDKMREQALAAQQVYMKQQLVWRISSSSAQAALVPAFEQAGLNATVEPQRYRAKVKVDLGSRTVRFFASYKTLAREGSAERLVQGVLDLRDAMERIGGDVKISR